MGYRVSFSIDTGGEEPYFLEQSFGHTYNCVQMFREVLGKEGINSLDTMQAKDCILALENAIIYMEFFPEKFKPMEPPNGWGTYETALDFLREILVMAQAHPKTTIHVS